MKASFKRATLACLGVAACALAGCACLDADGRQNFEPARVTFEELSAVPEKYSGRFVSVSAYATPTGLYSERVQLFAKDEGGACAIASNRSFSFARKDIRRNTSIRDSDRFGFRVEFTGRFHFEEVMVFALPMEMLGDGYFTDVSLRRKSETCLLRR